MSFAQGFQAGSAAVTRGLQLRDKRLEREKQEEYQAKLKEYDDQYRQGLAAEEQYANQLAGSGAQTPQVPLQPLAPAASAGAGGMMPTQPLAPAGAAPQSLVRPPMAPPAAMAPPQPAMSYADYQRGLASLAMQYGDPNATRLMAGAEQADQNARIAAANERRFNLNYGLARNADIRAQGEADRAAAEAARLGRLREGQGKVNELINQGVSDVDQFDALLTEYGSDGLDIGFVAGVLESRRGITKGAIEETMLGIQSDLRGITSTDALLTYYNDSETLSPGYSLKLERNDDGVLQLKHFNEENEIIEKDTINFSSEREADYYLRQRAVDPTTAMKSLVERDNARRTAAAERAIEESKLATERYGYDMGYKKEQMKAVASALEQLRDDKTFFMLDPVDRDDRIKRVYTDLGLEPPSSLGIPDLEDNATPPPKGAGLAAIEAAQTARAEKEQGERTVTSEAEEILSYKYGRGLFGSPDEELFNAGYEAASPEVKAEIDKLEEARAARRASNSRAIIRYGQLGRS